MVTLNPVAAVIRKIAVAKTDAAARRTSEGLALNAPLLKEYRLGANSGSINIGWQKNGAELNIDIAQLKRDGWDGVHIIGLGPGKTLVKCTSWDGVTIAVKRGPWIVKFDGMDVEAGYRCAIFAGEENKIYRSDGSSYVGPIEPGFQWHMVNVRGYAPPPEQLPRSLDGKLQRTKWVWFGYNVDRYWRNVVTDARFASEHGSYIHGLARLGSLIVGCHYVAAGAQCDKTRSDTTETAWAGPDVCQVFRDCTFENWHQPWSDRGGAGVVGESGACHWVFERCKFIGGYAMPADLNWPASRAIPANERALCVGISSEGSSYDMATGRPNEGFGNGWVVMRWCAAVGFSDVPWNNNLLRVGRNGGSMLAARGVVIEDCGLWSGGSAGVIVSIAQVPAGKTAIRRCNTDALQDWAFNNGVAASREATFPTSQRMVPVSEGISR